MAPAPWRAESVRTVPIGDRSVRCLGEIDGDQVEAGDGIGKVTIWVKADGVEPAQRAAFGDQRMGATVEIGTNGEVRGGR